MAISKFSVFLPVSKMFRSSLQVWLIPSTIIKTEDVAKEVCSHSHQEYGNRLNCHFTGLNILQPKKKSFLPLIISYIKKILESCFPLN